MILSLFTLSGDLDYQRSDRLHMLLKQIDMSTPYPEIQISKMLIEEIIPDSYKIEQHTDDQFRKSTLS